MLTHVDGGTGAGRKMHRGTVPREPWTCPHGHENLPNAANCLTSGCREKRPEAQLMLTADRFCPRCSEQEGRSVTTRWTNEHDGTLELACTGCGLKAGDPLTATEARRVVRTPTKPVRPLRQGYVVV
jgi:hypothetical protein